MDTCPVHTKHKLRDDLPPLTDRIARLPIDERGYPVPAFVQWMEFVDGKPVARPRGVGIPEFRMANPMHLRDCITEDLCWVCGEKLGVNRAYVIGPMCVINRNSAEPPSHVDCAEWSVKGCPFLTKPQMKRREDELTENAAGNVAGHMIKRNPGVIVIWQVRSKPELWNDGKGGILFDIGNPEKVTWWKEGRPATPEESIDAINSGIQTLLDACQDDEDRNEVSRRRDELVASLKGAK
jgi:hypothetical protein